MTRFGAAIAACIALLFLANSPALAQEEWRYIAHRNSPGLRTADKRSETEYSVDRAPRLRLNLRLIHLPSETPTDRIMIMRFPGDISVSPFGSRTLRFQLDGGAWETRVVPESFEHIWMLYLLDDGVIGRIRNAQRLTIEVRFRDYGVRQFEFDVMGLQWLPADDALEPRSPGLELPSDQRWVIEPVESNP